MIITGNTFYTLNSKYTKEEIDNAFKLLDDSDKQLIFDKYGKDLKHPTTPKKLESRNFFLLLWRIT